MEHVIAVAVYLFVMLVLYLGTWVKHTGYWILIPILMVAFIGSVLLQEYRINTTRDQITTNLVKAGFAKYETEQTSGTPVLVWSSNALKDAVTK